MKLTVGKVIWSLSFVLFLLFAYNQSTFMRVWDIFFGEENGITFQQEVVVADNVSPLRSTSPASSGEFDSTGVGGLSALSLMGSAGGSGEPEFAEFNEDEFDELYMEVERLKWELEQIEEELDEFKVKFDVAHAQEDDSMDNILAIATTLLPIIIPYFTRKNHDKEITVFKKGKDNA